MKKTRLRSRIFPVIPPINNPVITGIATENPTNAPGLFAKFFSALIGLLLTIATLWAFVNLIQGGLQWISSGGDKTALEGARNRITNAIIGLFITFTAWSIYILLLRLLGISSGGFNITLPTLF